MKAKEAIKRLRQETAPATYMPDFDKEECLQVVEARMDELEKQIQLLKAYLIKWAEELQLSGVNSKASVRAEIEKVLEDMKNGKSKI